jgi:hypothetical protein
MVRPSVRPVQFNETVCVISGSGFLTVNCKESALWRNTIHKYVFYVHLNVLRYFVSSTEFPFCEANNNSKNNPKRDVTTASCSSCPSAPGVPYWLSIDVFSRCLPSCVQGLHKDFQKPTRHSPVCEAISRSADQGMISILWNTKNYYGLKTNKPLVTTTYEYRVIQEERSIYS